MVSLIGASKCVSDGFEGPDDIQKRLFDTQNSFFHAAQQGDTNTSCDVLDIYIYIYYRF